MLLDGNRNEESPFKGIDTFRSLTKTKLSIYRNEESPFKGIDTQLNQ